MKISVDLEHNVVIQPQTCYIFRSDDPVKEGYNVCVGILDDVRKHVDSVLNAYIKTDREDQCSHCKRAWTESGDYYNGCCQEEWYDYCKRVALPYEVTE